MLTPESKPSMISIKKKSIAHKLAPGKVATASGYTWNTNPGPAIRKYINNISNSY